MTEVSITLDEHLDTPEQLVGETIDKMPTNRKDVFISFKAGEPDWSKFDVPLGEGRACCQVANAESGQAGSHPAERSDGQSEHGDVGRPRLLRNRSVTKLRHWSRVGVTSVLRHKLNLHPAGRGDFGHRTEPRISVSR